MSKPLIVIGSINADLYVRIERLPLPGETLAGREAVVRPGGKGANQAAAAARLGHPTAFVGQIGADAYGPELRQALASAGVDTSDLSQVPGETGQAFILLQSGGENSIILVGGANQSWTELPASIAGRLTGAGALLLQREIPSAVNLAAARLARRLHVPVVLDAGGSEAPMDAELAPLVDVLSPNELELAQLSGLPTADEAQVLSAARTLQSRGVGTVLVKLGARGSLLVPKHGPPIRGGVFPVDVLDTTGAGDCFTASYTVGLIAGLPEATRLRRAAAAAAICVSRIGAMPAMPDRAEVEALLARHPEAGIRE